MNKLQMSIKQLQSTLELNKAKTDKWEGIKSLVFNTFEQIKKEYPDLQLQTNVAESIRSVSIGFPIAPTTLGNGMNGKSFAKQGAWLAFSQTNNGNISVVEHSPVLIEEGDEAENIGEINEQIISLELFEHRNGEEVVYEKFAEFIDQVNDWESSNLLLTPNFEVGNRMEPLFVHGMGTRRERATAKTQKRRMQPSVM